MEIIRRKEQGIKETVKNTFREESVQFQKHMKTTPLMETEVEEEYYMDENLREMLRCSSR